MTTLEMKERKRKEMKSIYKKALEILKNRVSKLHINHKIGNKDIAKLEILDIAKAIENHVIPIFEQAITELEQAQKQEELLELYRKYFNVTEHWYETNNSGNIRKETAIEIEKLESELENDNT